MEPVTVTSGVRRTVRVAVALVVGQALLCALIGWLTLSENRPASRSTVDQLAVAPTVEAAPPAPPAVSATSSATSSASSSASSASPASSAPQRRKRTVPPSSPTPDPEMIGLPPAAADPTAADPTAPAPPTSAPASTAAPTPLPPSPPMFATPTVSPSSRPVTVGELCWPRGRFARTADGTLVRCESERHRRPRWKIV